jgi:uroporphyrinogen III methyltransferase/synthase
MLSEGAVHYVTFASSSTVRNLLEVLGSDGVSLLQKTTVACIGPVTARTAREAGLEVAVLASEATIDCLVGAILEHARRD